MASEDFLPVRFVMKPDDDVTHFHQPPGDVLILADLVRLVVGRPIDIDRSIVLTIVEVRLSRTGLDEVLPIAGWPEHEYVNEIEPLFLQLAVAPLS